MACQTMYKELPLLDDSELSAAERDSIQQHLAECPECAKEVEHLRTVQNALHSLRTVTVPADGPAKILQTVEANRSTRRAMFPNVGRLMRGYPLPLGSALIAAAVLIIFILPALKSEQPIVSPLSESTEMAQHSRMMPMQAFSAEMMELSTSPAASVTIGSNNPSALGESLLQAMEREFGPERLATIEILDEAGGMQLTVPRMPVQWMAEFLKNLAGTGEVEIADTTLGHFTDTGVDSMDVIIYIEGRNRDVSN